MDRKTQRHASQTPEGHRLIAGYRLLDGIPDEMIDPAGNVRPGWSELLAGFDELGPSRQGAL